MKAIEISATSNIPAYRQIYSRIKSAITAGEVSAHDRLPPVRSLSKQLCVSHLTVHRAYQELAGEHLIDLRHGSGAYVAPLQRMELARVHLEKFLTEGAIMDFEETAHWSNVDSLATMTPDVRLFDASPVFTNMLTAVNKDPWQLGFHTEGGLPALKNAFLSWMKQFDFSSETSKIVVSANPNSIGSLAKAILPPKASILLQQPTYLLAEDWLRRKGLNPLGIPLSPQGIDLAFLEDAALNPSITAILVSPNLGFGTGESWSKTTRTAFLEIARRANWTIIESYSRAPLAYNKPYPPLATEAPDLPIYTEINLSEMITPGLHFSWVVTPESIPKDTLKSLRQSSNIPLRPLQAALTAYLLSDQFDETLKKCARVYAKRHRIFQSSLATHLPSGFKLSNVEGGFSTVLQAPEPLDPADLFQATLHKNFPVMPGAFLGVGGACRNLVRLNFGSIDEGRLAIIGRQLAELLTYPAQFNKIS